MVNPINFLEKFYKDTMNYVGSDGVIKSDIDSKVKTYIDEILKRSESAKAVLTVIITSTVYKILNPEQDIRNHQNSIDNGYSGRTFDSEYITPFLKSINFPAMAESGWLTRSLEQKVPYDKNYPGAISPAALKKAFLQIIDVIQNGNYQEKILSYIFQGLIIRRNRQEIDLAKPVNLPINMIIHLLDRHFSSKYSSEGASRLPVLAIYAIYECLMKEVKRFYGKALLPIESHTSADVRSGRIGDIDIIDENRKPF